MLLEMFINFDGECREAVEFYAKVFRSEVGNLMTYSDTPSDSGYATSEADKNRIMYASVPIGDTVLMLMDTPSGYQLVKGNNVSPTISSDDKDEVSRMFLELSEGGTINTELTRTFFSDLYGSVTDKFGINWQILHYVPAPKKRMGKPRHRWSKEVSQIEFSVDKYGAKATVVWQSREEMVIKKGAVLKPDVPLRKDGTMSFQAKSGQMLRDENKDHIDEFVTTQDITLRSVNEVGLFLYFGGTNSWLELVDKDGRSINEWTVVT